MGYYPDTVRLVPVHQTAEYKEALDWMRKIYADGLVRPDWATVDTANFQVDSQKGVTGVFVDTMDGTKRIWKYFEDNAIADVNDASKIATMTSVGPINGHTLATTGYNGFYLITKSGAKTEEDVKAIIELAQKVVDLFYRLPNKPKGKGVTVNISVACFVPKPFTPFQWAQMCLSLIHI